MDASMLRQLKKEATRRRTLAIVSHPDAGKTTLTEKFLLYGGALHLAGSVTARKNHRSTTSDWMELEKKRGISISSTVLQFVYRDRVLNLIDTPGHNDFSEDTYRALTAVDAAVMVIDAGKGVEARTRKLFEVCRMRGAPIFTFMNKMDRPARDPLDLLDELEQVLGIATCPMNWPLGDGVDFRGVWDRQTGLAHLYERTAGGAYRAPVSTAGLDDPVIRDRMREPVYRKVVEDAAMIDGAGAHFDSQAVLAGEMTPVYFGSALNNFGVQLLLDGYIEQSAGPGPRRSGERIVQPDDPGFSGFVFKIQANMDPNHRDRIAFIRVVSGKFERDMMVTHARTGDKVRLSNATRLFGRERETVEEAWPGDVVGIVGKASFAIGDTLAEDPEIAYQEIPSFAPECLGYLENPDPSNFKRFRSGLNQLLQEGVVQVFAVDNATRTAPLLGAVGPLQFETVQYRLESEYGAASRLDMAPWTLARWLEPSVDTSTLTLARGVHAATDTLGRRVLLFPDEWNARYFKERHPDAGVSDTPYASSSLENR